MLDKDLDYIINNMNRENTVSFRERMYKNSTPTDSEILYTNLFNSLMDTSKELLLKENIISDIVFADSFIIEIDIDCDIYLICLEAYSVNESVDDNYYIFIFKNINKNNLANDSELIGRYFLRENKKAKEIVEKYRRYNIE